MFYNVYLRVGDSNKFSNIFAAENMLEGCHKLQSLDAGAKFAFEPISREMGDGTIQTTAETVKFEAATLRVTKAEYDFLRTYHHNELNDVLFLDPHDMRIVQAAYRMRLSIQQLAQSGDVALIKISGSLEAGASVIDESRFEVFFVDDGTDYALIEGIVVDEDDIPMDNAYVFAMPYVHSTGSSGEFSLLVPVAITEALDVFVDGYSFIPVSLSGALTAGQSYYFKMQEDKD